MQKRLPIVIAVSLGACGVAATADNAADSAQSSQPGKQATPPKQRSTMADLVGATDSGGMPGCFDPRLSGRARASAERLGGVPCENGAEGGGAGSGESWPGVYDGESDGGSLMVTVKESTGTNRYPVSVEAIGDDGCGGEVSGTAVVDGNRMAFTQRVPNMAEICRVTITRTGARVSVQEGPGCAYMHGMSCSFTGSATRRAQAASVRQSAPARAGAWLVGEWANKGEPCSYVGLVLKADGSYVTEWESGSWSLNGKALTFVARETGGLGEETEAVQPRPVRMTVVSHSANAYTTRHADGRLHTMVRCR